LDEHRFTLKVVNENGEASGSRTGAIKNFLLFQHDVFVEKKYLFTVSYSTFAIFLTIYTTLKKLATPFIGCRQNFPEMNVVLTQKPTTKMKPSDS
jgi:hypothetical protein